MLLLSLLAGAALAVADERINNEAEIRFIIKAEYEYATDACGAVIEIEYYQKGSSAHVESLLTNDDCDASSGTYIIQVRYRDADGQSQSKDFPETWKRLDFFEVLAGKMTGRSEGLAIGIYRLNMKFLLKRGWGTGVVFIVAVAVS